MCTFWHTWRSAKCNFIISVKAECSLPSCGTVMRVRERLGGSGTGCTGGLGPSTLFCLVNIYFLLWSMLRPRFSLWGGSSTITDFIPDHLLDSSNLAVTPAPTLSAWACWAPRSRCQLMVVPFGFQRTTEDLRHVWTGYTLDSLTLLFLTSWASNSQTGNKQLKQSLVIPKAIRISGRSPEPAESEWA